MVAKFGSKKGWRTFHFCMDCGIHKRHSGPRCTPCANRHRARINRGESEIANKYNQGPIMYPVPAPKHLRPKMEQAVLYRDEYHCVHCGITGKNHLIQFNQRLHIHHLNKNREDNSLGNLCTLCTSCHTKQHLGSPSTMLAKQRGQTLSRRYKDGTVIHWATGLTKETHPGIAAMAQQKLGRIPWNKKIS